MYCGGVVPWGMWCCGGCNEYLPATKWVMGKSGWKWAEVDALMTKHLPSLYTPTPLHHPTPNKQAI